MGLSKNCAQRAAWRLTIALDARHATLAARSVECIRQGLNLRTRSGYLPPTSLIARRPAMLRACGRLPRSGRVAECPEFSRMHENLIALENDFGRRLARPQVGPGWITRCAGVSGGTRTRGEAGMGEAYQADSAPELAVMLR